MDAREITILNLLRIGNPSPRAACLSAFTPVALVCAEDWIEATFNIGGISDRNETGMRMILIDYQTQGSLKYLLFAFSLCQTAMDGKSLASALN